MQKLIKSIIPVGLALMQASCVFSVTSIFCWENIPYRPRGGEVQSPCCYKVGDLYYMPVIEKFCQEGCYVLACAIGPLSGNSLSDWTLRTEDDCFTETTYFLMTPQDAAVALGATIADPPAGTKPFITADDWDATVAQPVPVKKWRHADSMIAPRTYSANGHLNHFYCAADGSREADFTSFRTRYRADALYKVPLTALLFVGVDVPVTVVGSTVYTLITPFVAGVKALCD